MDSNIDKSLHQLDSEIYSVEKEIEYLRCVYFEIQKINTDMDIYNVKISILREREKSLLKNAEKYVNRNLERRKRTVSIDSPLDPKIEEG